MSAYRFFAVFVALGVTASLVAGCAAESSVQARSADQHATTAGVVMTRTRDLEPTSWIVQSIIGTGSDDKIEALTADGTIYDGTVVLRITVTGDGLGNPDVVRCYRYTFRNRISDDKPRHISCPANATPTPLPSLVSEDLYAPDVQQRLIAVLTGATAAQRRDPTALKQLIEQSFGPPALIAVWTDPGPESYGVRIAEGEECLTANLVGSAVPTVQAASGANCRGG